MSRSKRSSKVRSKQEVVMPTQDIRPVTFKANSEPIRPKNIKQEKYLNALKNFDIVFGVGSAGGGKSYLSIAYAADMLKAGLIDKIVITRPNVEVGRSLGFLPGTKEEKYREFLLPILSILYDRLGKSFAEFLIKSGKIEPIPLGFMRGTTIKDCICIADEMENSTPAEMKMLLTRIGDNCKLFINGDINQQDIRGNSGLEDALTRVSYMPFIKVITFTPQDSVRSAIITEILKAYGEV